MSKVIDYRWICHKCRAENDAGLDVCSSCGLPAIASAAQAGLFPSEPNRRQPVFLQHAYAFFPEIIVAAFVTLASPFWFVSLLLNNKFLAALVLAAFVVLGTVIFWFASLDRSSVRSWLGMAFVLLGAYIAFRLSH